MFCFLLSQSPKLSIKGIGQEIHGAKPNISPHDGYCISLVSVGHRVVTESKETHCPFSELTWNVQFGLWLTLKHFYNYKILADLFALHVQTSAAQINYVVAKTLFFYFCSTCVDFIPKRENSDKQHVVKSINHSQQTCLETFIIKRLYYFNWWL